MASDTGRSAESLHVLLARAGTTVINTIDDVDLTKGDAADAADLAAYLPAHHRNRGSSLISEKESDLINIEEELRVAAEQVSRDKAANGSERPARYDFVHLGEEIAGAMVKAAEAQVAAAQAALEQTRIRVEKLAAEIIAAAEAQVEVAQKTLEACRDPADGLREQIKSVDQQLANLNDRLKAFGETILEGHRQFNDSKGEGT